MRPPNPYKNANRLLTADEVAEHRQVSRSHVYALVRAARIPTVAVGYYRFRLDARVEREERGGTRMLRSNRDGPV